MSTFDEAKKEFFRQWGVDGMPADKIRLVNAAAEYFNNAALDHAAKLARGHFIPGHAVCSPEFAEYLAAAIEKEKI